MSIAVVIILFYQFSWQCQWYILPPKLEMHSAVSLCIKYQSI